MRRGAEETRADSRWEAKINREKVLWRGMHNELNDGKETGRKTRDGRTYDRIENSFAEAKDETSQTKLDRI